MKSLGFTRKNMKNLTFVINWEFKNFFWLIWMGYRFSVLDAWKSWNLLIFDLSLDGPEGAMTEIILKYFWIHLNGTLRK